VADLVRAAGDAFIGRSRKWISWKHVKVLLAIARCRTAALGGHLDECTRCGHRAISYNSCRNRHCPKCQAGARDRWLTARRQELLPTRYVHVVFTLPRHLAPLVLQNKKVIYDLLFRTVRAETLLEVAPVQIVTNKVAGIGSGNFMDEYKRSLDELSDDHQQSFSIMQWETNMPGGMGTGLGFRINPPNQRNESVRY
jgi:transposase-like zinc-binding protein